MAGTAFLYASFSVPSPVEPDLLRGPCLPRLLLAKLSGARPARPLDGVISPQGGKASIALPQWRRRDFLPLGLPPRKRGDLGCAHSSRAKKVSPPPSSAVLRPCGCVVDRLRLTIAIEAAMVAGSNSQGEATWQPSVPSRNPATANSRARSSP